MGRIISGKATGELHLNTAVHRSHAKSKTSSSITSFTTWANLPTTTNNQLPRETTTLPSKNMKITALPVAISAISASVSVCDESSVSVCRDATYTINVPENQLCAGPTSENPHGTACPKKGDVASDRCYSYLKSWNEYEDKCIAPEDAQCMKLNSGAWGCVFPSVGCDTPKPETTTSTTLKPTTSTTTSTTSKPTTTSTDKCYRPLNYQGCNQDSIKCGTFGGFELVCNTDGNPGGQCRCDFDPRIPSTIWYGMQQGCGLQGLWSIMQHCC